MHPAKLASLCLLAFSTLAHADRVTLKNGDSLSGEIVAKRGSSLVFKTAYAGEVTISWDEVSSLSSDKPVAVMLQDESFQTTTLALGTPPPSPVTGNDNESSNAEGEDGNPPPAKEPVTSTATLALKDILFINPNPEESGRGYQLSARANLGLLSSSGNSESEQLNGDAEMVMRAKAYRFTLGAAANQGAYGGITSVSNRRAYTSYDSFFNPREFIYARGLAEQDRYKDINLRSVIGGGYGYMLYDTDSTSLSLKGGLDMVSVERYVAESERFAALGWNINFKHKLSLSELELFHVQDGYRGLNAQGDILLQTRTGLRIPISGGLTATAQYNLDWESNPAPDRKGTDSKIMFGIGYAYN